MRVVVALGGNALLRRGEPPDASAQTARLAEVAPHLRQLVTHHQVIFVHGNGPQVGLLASESADDPELTSPYPLGLLSAATQGIVGSMIQQALRDAGLTTPTATVITHTQIAEDDPALTRPEKFIGAVYDSRRAHELARAHGWTIGADGGGWRRVVPSPRPERILELDAGRMLLEYGFAVIMGGGGGVPILLSAGHREIVDAVIDKDHTAALLAGALDADLLAILTDVPGVIAGYGTPDATVIAETTPALLRTMDLPPGTMGPKAQAACDFVLATGKPAIIGPLEHAEEVVAGVLGTKIAPPQDITAG